MLVGNSKSKSLKMKIPSVISCIEFQQFSFSDPRIEIEMCRIELEILKSHATTLPLYFTHLSAIAYLTLTRCGIEFCKHCVKQHTFMHEINDRHIIKVAHFEYFMN